MQLENSFKYIISELINSGFYFVFSLFKNFWVISGNCIIMKLLNALSTPCRPCKNFFWIKLGSKNKDIHLRDFKNAFLKYEF